MDWLRVSGPRAQRHAALRLLEAFFGKSEPGKGRYFLSCGDRIGDCGVYYDDPASGEKAAEHMVVDISGGMLSELESNDLVHQLTHELYALGCSATRIDIAVDFDDQPDLIETAYQACKQGKLAGAKCFRIVESENARGSDGRTLYIGKRGKMGSGRMLRVYDKGLETRTKDAGEWVRWEAEYTHDCARQVGDAYARADDPVKCLLQHAFGVCDFKEDPDEKNLSRRPRCKWFEKLVGLIDPSTVRAERAASTIYSKVRWFKDAVAPMLRTVQRVTGADLDRIVHEITGQVQTKPNKLHEPFVRGLCNSLGVPQLNIVSAYWNSPIRV
ncbi:MAG: replication initiation factor domain-containing protein [Phycisphaerales bacterium]